MSVSVSMSVSVDYQFKYGAMNIYVDMAIILPIPKGPTGGVKT
jgi:hypothetical protein